MSGAEASLALAVLPLVLSAVKHYDDALDPLRRYRGFVREAQKLAKELEVQRTIFRDECRNLLEDVTDHDAASGMLRKLSEEEWSNTQLESRLIQHLGESKQACIDVIDLIEERLREIDTENRKFGAVLTDAYCQAREKKDSESSYKRIARKLSFSFSKSRLNQNISALRSYNVDLEKLSRHIRPQISSTSYSLFNNSHDGLEAIRKYQTIRQAAQQVYKALREACNKHSEHFVHFPLEVQQVVLDRERAPQVHFNMGYAHMTIADAAGLADPIWFLIDSCINDQYTSTPIVHSEGMKELGKTLKRRLEHAVEPLSEKVHKSIQSQPRVAEHYPWYPVTIAPDAFSSESCMRRDLCDDLRRRFREPRKAGICIGILQNTERCKHYVYPSSHTPQSPSRKAVSLQQLINSVAHTHRVRSIPIHERLSLARKLAVAVLQYHTTPWLKLAWRSDDIVLFGIDEETKMPSITNFPDPHLNARIKGLSEESAPPSGFPSRSLARNPTLFSLGVVLLELAYAANLKSLREDGDLTNGREDQYTDFFTARRLATSKRSTMGLRYDKIVEQLVECIFPNVNDLNNDELQTAFYNNVISPLEGLEEGFRKMHLEV